MYPLPNLNLSIVYGIWYILLRVTFINKVIVDRRGRELNYFFASRGPVLSKPDVSCYGCIS